MNSGYLKELIPCCGPRIHYCVIRLEIVLSTLVSPTRRTESNPVVIAFYEKKQVVSRTHLKKNDYHGVRNTPLSDKLRLGRPWKVCMVNRSLTG